MDLFKFLHESHEIQRTLCQSVLRAKDEKARLSSFLQLKTELEAHAAAEERFLYVPLLMIDGGLSASRHALAEHHEIEEYCEELSVANKATKSWNKTAKELSDEVHHHLKEEESKFFKLAGRILGPKKKATLAKQYAKEIVRMRRKLAHEFATITVGTGGHVKPKASR